MSAFLKDEITLVSKYKKFLSRLKPFRNKIIFILILDIAASLLTLIAPYLTKPFIDNGVIKKNINVLLILAVISGILYLLNELILIIRELLARKYQARLSIYLSKNFINHLYSLDLGFFQAGSSMNQVSRSNYYLSQLDAISFDLIPRMIALLVKPAFILTICFFMNLRLTLLALCLLPLVLLHKRYFNEKDRLLSVALEKKQQEISVKLSDSFSRIRLVKYFSKESRQIEIFLRNLLQKIKIINRTKTLNLVGDTSGRFIAKVFIGVIFLYGLYEMHLGILTFGGLSAIMLYLQQFIESAREFMSKYNALSKKLFFVDRYYEIMAQTPRIKNPAHPIHLKHIKGDIEFKNITFDYDTKKLILKDISFKVEGGKWVAIIGKSGIGKTTIYNLMLRLFDPKEGVITLDGYEIKKFNLSDLTKNIVIAPQEPLLFNQSIRENIMFSLDRNDDDKMIETAKLMLIHDYIMSLPKEYDSVVGEDGCTLSRGQKQRIVLTRAMINNPPILILDEATSSLDAETEKEIYKNIKLMRPNLTTIVTSHRFATAALSDYVILIKNADKAMVGIYEDLLKEGA